MASFGKALKHLKRGGEATRTFWQGEGCIGIYTPPEGRMICGPCLFQKLNGFDAEPWVPRNRDMFAEDWVLLD